MVGIMSFYHNWMHFPLTSQSLSFFVGLQPATNCLLGFKISELRKPQVGKNHSELLGSSWIINRTFPSVWRNRPENYCGSRLREASLKKASFLRGLQSDSSSLVHLYDAGLSLKKNYETIYIPKKRFPLGIFLFRWYSRLSNIIQGFSLGSKSLPTVKTICHTTY